MKVTIEIPALLSALRVIGPALARTNPVRMASCGWTARDGHVTLRAASLDWDAQYHVPAQIITGGEAWMPADLVRALPWGRLVESIQIRATAHEVEIRSGRIVYALPLLEPGSVMALAPGLAPCADAPATALARTLLLGASAAHRAQAAGGEDAGSGEPGREGAWLEITGDRITLSSTDRVRVASASTAAMATAHFRVALPIHAALALARAAAQAESATLLRAKRDPSPALTVTAGPATVTVRALAALPPDPAGLDLDTGRAPTRLRGRADNITTGLRAALAVAGTDPYATVRLCTKRAHLELQVAGGGGRASVTVALEHATGPEADITLPARAFLAVLAPLGGAEVTLGLSQPSHPVQIAAVDGAVAYHGLVATTKNAEETVRAATVIASD